MNISPYYRNKINSIKEFDYNIDYSQLDLRKHPELYRIGRGEQWVLLVRPYKSEILPHWRFRTPDIAQESARTIYSMFEQYLADDDFVWADMARKFLQMGYTRSRRYANHKSGRKYATNPQVALDEKEYKIKKSQILPQEDDALTNEKAESARIFYGYYKRAKEHPDYLTQKQKFLEFLAKYEDE